MKNYKLESEGPVLAGIIYCGARIGYEDNKEYSMEEIFDLLDSINEERESQKLPIPSCMINETFLLGRTGYGSYHEKVYCCKFSWSPRSGEISSEKFKEVLYQYADQLGNSFKQERMYIEFEGRVEGFKKI
ncbi:hypothetical protein ACFL1H_05205 [Nanoarchaeota archaeon]